MHLRLLDRAVLACVSALVLFVLFSPYCFGGYPIGHSHGLNVSWTKHFLSQLDSGQPYPRWLTDYVGGLGAPVFYFYAPAPFYLAAAVEGLCAGCGIATILSLTHVLMVLLSGASFFLWARTLAPVSLSLFGALWYMALPYHSIELAVRDALGEGMAYVFMPLVLLGLARVPESRRWLCLAAVAYAALILTHLPTALLFTPAMAVFALAQAGPRSGWRVVPRLVGAGLLGACLAGIYLVPALLLREHLVPDGWVTASGPHYQPENWLIGGAGPERIADGFWRLVLRSLALSSGVALGGIALLLVIHRLSGSAEPPLGRRHGRTLAAAVACSVAGWAMMTAPAEWLWVNVHLLRQVQFPWRLGTVIELCNATILTICLARCAVHVPSLLGLPGRVWANLGYAATVTAMAVVLSRVEAPRTNALGQVPQIAPGAPESEVPLTDPSRAYGITLEYIPTEYRTAWVVESEAYAAPVPATPDRAERDLRYDRWRDEVAALPFVSVSVAGGPWAGFRHDVRRAGASAFDISVSLERPAAILVRIVYFPSWSLTDRGSGREVPIAPSSGHGLIRFELPAGTHSLRLETKMLPEEVLGAFLSGAGLLVVLVTLIRVGRGLPPERDDPSGRRIDGGSRRLAPLPLDRRSG